MESGRAQLVEHYPYFCTVVARVAQGLSQHLREECESEALVAMVDAADDFVQNGVTFKAFVSRRIEQRMLDEARRHSTTRRSGTARTGHSLDQTVGEGGGTYGDLLVSREAGPAEQLEAREKLERIVALPLRWQLAMSLPVADAAEELGVTPGRVVQIRSQARDVIEERVPPPIVVVTVPPVTAAVDAPISPRELEVLHLIATGDTSQEVATALDIGTESVKTHLQHLVSKLYARNRTHAVHIAWQHDWWKVV